METLAPVKEESSRAEAVRGVEPDDMWSVSLYLLQKIKLLPPERGSMSPKPVTVSEATTIKALYLDCQMNHITPDPYSSHCR